MYDADWIRFFLRTTTPSVELVPPKALAILNGLPMLKAFILWILIRDPLFRPSLDEMRMKGFAIKQSLLGQNICTRSKLPQTSIRSNVLNLMRDQWVISSDSWSSLSPPKILPKLRDPIFYASLSKYIFRVIEASSCLDDQLCRYKTECILICAHKTCHYRESAVGQEKIALTKKLHCQAISLGIPVLAVALPELAAHGHKAQLDFASAINTTISFTESALLAGEGQICLLCVPGDEDAALTLGTALHIRLHHDSVLEAIRVLSKMSQNGEAVRLPAAYLARLSAWNATRHLI